MRKKTTVLLIKRVPSLGHSGDVVQVAAGYARNFLIPYSHALLATPANLRRREKLLEVRAKEAKEQREWADQMKRNLERLLFEFEVKVDELGHLYGSVSGTDVYDLLKEQGYTVDKSMIKLTHPLKSLGRHTIPIRLHEEVEVALQVRVKNDAFEAYKQEMATGNQ